jgi:sugar lactone lactonase YvrE
MFYPVGIAIDHSGNLYVANRLRSGGNVVVYAPGSKTPSRTITDGVTSPVGITIDASGTLYVTNITEQNVEEYLPGEDHPFETITQGMTTPVAVTVNKKGWLLVANLSQDTVVEFPPGSITLSKRRVSKGLHGPEGLALFPPVLP